MRVFSTLLLIAGSLSLASADSVNLRSGEVVQGTYLGGTARQIRVDVNGSIQSYDVGQVASVTFSEPEYQRQSMPVRRPVPEGPRAPLVS
ncbi:MAG: hypothetical protein M3N54_02970 [Acidobacteriota bacterium]|nr:hypothetical protein [Acidobacteriota bacterium]